MAKNTENIQYVGERNDIVMPDEQAESGQDQAGEELGSGEHTEQVGKDDVVPVVPEANPEARQQQYVQGQVEVHPFSEEAKALHEQGKTRTGLDKAAHAAVGVGGDYTIAPGGSAGAGSGPVDIHGLTTQEVDPRQKRNIDENPGMLRGPRPPREEP